MINCTFWCRRLVALAYSSYRRLRNVFIFNELYSPSPTNLNTMILLYVYRYNSIPRSYYRKSDIVVLTYDVTNKQSFLNLTTWLKTVKVCLI